MDLKALYIGLLQNLLPRGQAWNAAPETVLYKILSVIATPFAEAHGRALQLLEEADPRTTSEMLIDWESEYGLPDSCTGMADTVEERQMALVQKVHSTGGQSREYFISVAAMLGYDIQIIEYRAFECGISECGVGQLTDMHGIQEIGTTELTAINHYWTVKVLGPRVTWFQCGISECGKDTLAKISRAEDLECLFRRYQPAQTELIFVYEENDVPTLSHLGMMVTHLGQEITL